MTELKDAGLADLLPKAWRERPEVQALDYAMRKMLSMILRYSEQAQIYTAIEKAPDELLDILAVQFRAPRYRQDYDLETKRKLVRSSLPYYTTVGTKGAVENTLGEMYGKAAVQEWFEYGGTPGCFRLSVEETGRIDIEELLDILEKVKRKTAHLDVLELDSSTKQCITIGFAAVTVGEVHTGTKAGEVESLYWYADADGNALVDADDGILTI